MADFPIAISTGATDLDPIERRGLLADYISTNHELNQLEQSNIIDANLWLERQTLDDLISVTFILKLHAQMLNQVWEWAGKIRDSNKNIGVPKEDVMNNLGILVGDVNYWIEHQTYPIDEIAARLHHGLVKIHVFANGNGRHARLMADTLLRKYDQQRFSWGANGMDELLAKNGALRTEYITSLQLADAGDFERLFQFVRS